MDRETPNATLARRDDVTCDIARFTIRPDDGVPAFEPGQYLALGIRVGDRLVQRPYSTASRPASGETLEFLIRRVPGGTLTPQLWGLRPGSRLRLGRPKGLFTLLPDDDRAHLFVATGTGLAPFMSMLDALLERPAPPPVMVVHGVARATELAYRQLLQGLAAQCARIVYAPTVSRPGDLASAGWSGRVGRAETVLGPLLDEHAPVPGSVVAYLCGNPGMVVAAEHVLRERGLSPGAVRTEHYWPLEDPALVA